MPTMTVNALRLSHEAILNSLLSVQAVSRSYLQAKPALFEFNERIRAYLEKQDSEMYERLRAIFAQDREALKMLEFLEHDLRDLKVQFLIFSEKHTGDLANQSGRNFIKEFKGFADAVIARVKVEESYLVPLLVRIKDSG